MFRLVRTAFRTARLAVVVAGYATTAFRLWDKYGDTVRRKITGGDLPASPYPSAGATASPPPVIPPGPVDPELVGG